MTNEIKTLIDNDLDNLIELYNHKIKSLFNETKGGTIRGEKGKLVEDLAKKVVELTWTKVLNQSKDRLEQNNKKQNVYIKNALNYIKRKEILESEKERIKKDNKSKIKYKFSTDVHVLIDGKLAIAIECKAYTESAMLKRIIFDSMLIEETFSNATYCLFQLEEAFSNDQYHVLMSHHTHNIDVLTLLEGKRNAEKPIHKEQFFKELHKEKLIEVVEYFSNVLKKYANS